MLNSETREPARINDGIPTLMVLVDTEEEFDWTLPHSREATSVDAMAAQFRAHEIYDRFGVTPVYVIDYPVASQPDGFRPLLELFQDGKCEVGAHLHPWVNPPHEEDVCPRNTYPGNLPPALERQKLRVLTDIIGENFNRQPKIYKAGRYGAGPATAGILEDLGYEIDTSILPATDLGADGGPDFSIFDPLPFWFGKNRRLLELPMTVGFSGAMRQHGKRLHDALISPVGWKMHLPGLFARLRLIDRVTLTPEGIALEEMKRLTRAMIADGHLYFSLTYHSPSLTPGNTPYVPDAAALEIFLNRIESFLDFFTKEIGGRTASATDLMSLMEPAAREETF